MIDQIVAISDLCPKPIVTISHTYRISSHFMQMPEVQIHSIGQNRLLYKFAAHEKRVR